MLKWHSILKVHVHVRRSSFIVTTAEQYSLQTRTLHNSNTKLLPDFDDVSRRQEIWKIKFWFCSFSFFLSYFTYNSRIIEHIMNVVDINKLLYFGGDPFAVYSFMLSMVSNTQHSLFPICHFVSISSTINWQTLCSLVVTRPGQK